MNKNYRKILRLQRTKLKLFNMFLQGEFPFAETPHDVLFRVLVKKRIKYLEQL